jgi:hypothetical protein
VAEVEAEAGTETETETAEAEPASIPTPENPSSSLRSSERGSPLTLSIEHEFSISRHKHYELVLNVDAARSISKTSRGYVLGGSMGISRFNQAP